MDWERGDGTHFAFRCFAILSSEIAAANVSKISLTTTASVSLITNRFDSPSLNKTKRQKVYDQMCNAAEALLEELDVNIFIRKPLMWFYIQRQIKQLLAL
jgi:hypothetical protein